MKYRPILFSTPMVRALLAGTKTQTRRIVKPQPLWVADPSVPFRTPDADPKGIIRCPYGQPGDRLWVRETWRAHKAFDIAAPNELPKIDGLHYEADEKPRFWDYGKLRPSIHMPRWVSRITLEITGVRCERLHEISEADAINEGIEVCGVGGWRNYLWHGEPDAPAKTVEGWPHQFSNYHLDPVGSYSSLWERINGPNSWAANPWVWVVSFRRITTDDAMPANSRITSPPAAYPGQEEQK